MRRILKFPLGIGQPTEIRTGDAPRFLAVEFQGVQLVAWAEAEVGDRTATWVWVGMTGDDVPQGGEYVGTTTTIGPFVAHVYVVPS